MNVSRKILIILILGLNLLFSNCRRSDTKLAEDVDKEFKEAEENKDEVVAYFLGVTHRVADLDAWKSAFDADEPKRVENGIELLEILIDMDVRNNIMTVYKVENQDIASAYIYSDQLKASMERAGVISEPEIKMWDILDILDSGYQTIYPKRLVVTHQIKGYEVWREEFDNHQDVRNQYGITTIGIGRNHAKPNQISVMFACDDTEKAREYANSEEFQEKMMVAGVSGRPEIGFFKILQNP